MSKFILSVAVVIGFAGALQAELVPESLLLKEEQAGTSVDLSLLNNSGTVPFLPNEPVTPVDITAIVAEAPGGSNPVSVAAGWSAATLTATSWNEPMDAAAGSLTWAQYTGEAFPGSPVSPNTPIFGYFAGFTLDSSNITFFPGVPVFPGNPIFQGLSYTGTAVDPPFMVFGPPDGTSGPYAAGSFQSFSGDTLLTPEPSSLILAALGAAGLLLAVLRRQG